MKMIAAILFFALSSLAHAAEPGANEGFVKNFAFECRFEAFGWGKLPDKVCEVSGRVCGRFDIASGMPRCENGEDAFKVHCTDGFRILTDEVHVRKIDGKLQIYGATDDRRAVLSLEKVGHLGSQSQTFDTELVTFTRDYSPIRMQGECDVKSLGQHD